MIKTEYKVLVVDDHPENIRVLADTLKAKYEVSVATKGEVALASINSAAKPDIVLLDVMMPRMDGYEVCRQIRANEDNQFIPVMFISAADTLADKLKGYQAGGNDYVIKPFSLDEILNKVKVLLANASMMKELKNNVSNVTKTAMVAMTSASEMGQVIEFFRKSFTCHSFDELAELLLSNLADQELNGVIQLYCESEKINKAWRTPVMPLEIQVIEELKGKQRIYNFSNRTVFNYSGISLLIKNMPVENEDLYGRIKDNVAFLVEGASERVKGIEYEMQAIDREQALNKLIEMTEQALSDIDNRQQQQKLTSESIMRNLLEKVSDAFLTLGLDEQQEDELLDLIKKSAEKEQENYEQGKLTDQHLADVLAQLQQSVHTNNSN